MSTQQPQKTVSQSEVLLEELYQCLPLPPTEERQRIRGLSRTSGMKVMEIRDWLKKRKATGPYRGRPNLSFNQVQSLEWLFSNHTQYPTPELKKVLTDELQMTEYQIGKWFETRRQRKVVPVLLTRKKEQLANAEEWQRIRLRLFEIVGKIDSGAGSFIFDDESDPSSPQKSPPSSSSFSDCDDDDDDETLSHDDDGAQPPKRNDPLLTTFSTASNHHHLQSHYRPLGPPPPVPARRTTSSQPTQYHQTLGSGPTRDHQADVGSLPPPQQLPIRSATPSAATPFLLINARDQQQPTTHTSTSSFSSRLPLPPPFTSSYQEQQQQQRPSLSLITPNLLKEYSPTSTSSTPLIPDDRFGQNRSLAQQQQQQPPQTTTTIPFKATRFSQPVATTIHEPTPLNNRSSLAQMDVLPMTLPSLTNTTPRDEPFPVAGGLKRRKNSLPEVLPSKRLCQNDSIATNPADPYPQLPSVRELLRDLSFQQQQQMPFHTNSAPL
mmetsp:Transcript_41693/g.58169  ORF Transcript_41693/g.58169 Transcript_41693/m.58169 type:complete len:493 (-) Transcript_41693:14-1492(-)